MTRKWPCRPLGELAQIVGGGTPSTADPTNFGGGVPWVTPKDLSGYADRYIAGGARDLSEQGLKACAARLLPAGTVLLSTRAPVGYVAIARTQLATNQGFRSLILRPGHSPEFFMHLLRLYRPVLESRANGSTFKELKGSELAQIEVPVPPPDVQHRIAQQLNALDDKRLVSRRLASTLVELAQFTYLRCRMCFGRDGQFGDLGVIAGGSTPSTREPRFWDGPHPWATPTDVTQLAHPYLRQTARTLTDDGLRVTSSSLHPPGSVLITSRATIGAVAVNEVPCATNQGFIVLRPDESAHTWVLLHEVLARVGELNALASGSTFRELTKTSFRELRVPIPQARELEALDRELGIIHRRARLASLQEAASAGALELAAHKLILDE
jgi:type I restriction enzyme, S subunit